MKEIIMNVEERNKSQNDTKESQADETIENVELNDCKNCSAEEKRSNCIMKHCLTDNDDAKSECSDFYVDESLEEILEKAKHFDLSNEDIEDVTFSCSSLVDEDRAGTLHIIGDQYLDIDIAEILFQQLI